MVQVDMDLGYTYDVAAPETAARVRRDAFAALEGRGGWLMVFDNADDDLALVCTYLPPSGSRGHVLITSRASGRRLVRAGLLPGGRGLGIEAVQLSKMDVAASQALLWRLAWRGSDPLTSDREALESLAGAGAVEREAVALLAGTQGLDGLPLALEQAAKFVWRGVEGFRSYWDWFRKEALAVFADERGVDEAEGVRKLLKDTDLSDEHVHHIMTKLAIRKFEELRKVKDKHLLAMGMCVPDQEEFRAMVCSLDNGGGVDRDRLTVRLTFLRNYRQVWQIDPTAARLLEACAFFAPDAIPLRLLQRCLGEGADPRVLVEQLVDYGSLLSNTANGQDTAVSMHRLVQSVLLEELRGRECVSAEVFTGVVTAGGDSLIQTPLTTALDAMVACMRGEVEVLKHSPSQHVASRQRSMEIEPHAKALYVNGRRHFLASRCKQTATPLSYVAWALGDTAISRCELRKVGKGVVVGEMRWAAEQLHLEALEMRQEAWGVAENHEDIAHSLKSCASVYDWLGEYRTAKEYGQRALAMWNDLHKKLEDITPPQHEHIAGALLTMGYILNRLNSFHEALVLVTQSLEMYRLVHRKRKDEDVSTIQHVDSASSLHALGNVCHCMGQFEDARRYHTQSLDMKRLVYRKSEDEDVSTIQHAGIAASLHALGNVCHSLGKFEDARRYYTQSLDMKRLVSRKSEDEDVSTIQHADIAASLHALGAVQRGCDDFPGAVVLLPWRCQRALWGLLIPIPSR